MYTYMYRLRDTYYIYMYFFRLELSRRMNQSWHECSATPGGRREPRPAVHKPTVSIIDYYRIANLIISDEIV